MLKNSKYFVPPPRDDSNFKEIFKRLAAVGAGRPADEAGLALSPWTPELLTEAISQIDANRNGIDLRTVQLWFQDNQKGISADNIRWLARVFGCDDPLATSEWQKELNAAQARLATKRKETRAESLGLPRKQHTTRITTIVGENDSGSETTSKFGENGPKFNLNLAKRSEAILTQRSPLDLPVLVFAGAVALGFLAYMFRIHSFVYSPLDGPTRQVGFIWAPNWTILFLILLPLYLSFVSELLGYWKNEGRSKLLVHNPQLTEEEDGWARKVGSSSYSYWASFFLCLPFAALFQWINSRLIPLTSGDPGNFAMDWGRIAIVRPDVISVTQALTFTGLAYLYMGVCFFLLFVGFILLYTLAHDFWEVSGASKPQQPPHYQQEFNGLCARIMHGILRCTVLGLLIAIVMKLQSTFLISGEVTILDWLIGDLASVLKTRDEMRVWLDRITPTHFSSLLVVLVSCAVFLHGSIRISAAYWWSCSADSAVRLKDGVQRDHIKSNRKLRWWRMAGLVAFLVVNYILIGVFDGFSISLVVGVVLAIYSLFDPEFDHEWLSKPKGNQRVL